MFIRPILRVVGKTVFLVILITAGCLAIFAYHQHNSAQFQIDQLQQQKQELEQIVQRIQTDRRVAKIVVTDQTTVAGQMKTTLLFVEYRKDGTALLPKQYTIIGNEAHFDGQIIKFKDQYTRAADALRGQSIMLFTRVYGATQAPNDGFPIDEPGKIPEIYRGIDPKISEFEQNLWNNFWTLYNDQSAREAQGIRGLHGEGLYGRLDPDHVYTITLRPDGGTLNEEPIDPIYREAIRHAK